MVGRGGLRWGLLRAFRGNYYVTHRQCDREAVSSEGLYWRLLKACVMGYPIRSQNLIVALMEDEGDMEQDIRAKEICPPRNSFFTMRGSFRLMVWWGGGFVSVNAGCARKQHN